MRASRRVTVRGQLSATRRIVRHDQNGRVQPLVQIVNQPQNFRAGVRVEIAGRLVGQQHRRIERQRARDGHALPLAAGKLVGQMLHPLPQLHQVQQFARAFVDLLARPAPFKCSGSATFSTQVRLGSRLKNWKDEADLVAAQPGQRRRRKRRERLPVDPDLARRRPVEPADQIQQRGFSGAGRPHDRHHLAAGDLEVHGVERDHLALAVEVLDTRVSEIIKFNDEGRDDA